MAAYVNAICDSLFQTCDMVFSASYVRVNWCDSRSPANWFITSRCIKMGLDYWGLWRTSCKHQVSYSYLSASRTLNGHWWPVNQYKPMTYKQPGWLLGTRLHLCDIHSVDRPFARQKKTNIKKKMKMKKKKTRPKCILLVFKKDIPRSGIFNDNIKDLKCRTTHTDLN